MGRLIKHILNGIHQTHYLKRAIGQSRELMLVLNKIWQKENLNQFVFLFHRHSPICDNIKQQCHMLLCFIP